MVLSGFAYPSERDRKVWISFSDRQDGSVVALISEPGPIDTTGRGAVEITVYAEVLGHWGSEDEAKAEVAKTADQVILELGL